jgi:tetratricopeptide (TPR) repeat protein
LGDWDVARAHLESSAELLASTGGLDLRAQVAADLALVTYRLGTPESEQIGEQAMRLAAESGDAVSMAQALNVIGVLAGARGETDAGVDHLMKSREQARVSGSTELEVAALNNLARLYAQGGDIDCALTSAHEALRLGRVHGDLHRVAALHDHLADLYHQADQQNEAMEQLKAAAVAFGAVDEAQARPGVWKLVSW